MSDIMFEVSLIKTIGEQSNEPCKTCDDSGYITDEITVSWVNIKAIYKKIVEHFGEKR